eukprot:g788.t1
MVNFHDPVVYSSDDGSDDEAPEEMGQESSKDLVLEALRAQHQAARAAGGKRRKRRRKVVEEKDSSNIEAEELPAELLAGIEEAEEAEMQSQNIGNKVVFSDSDDEEERSRRKRNKKVKRTGDLRTRKGNFELVVSKKISVSSASCEAEEGISKSALAFKNKHFFGNRIRRGKNRRGKVKFTRR